MIYEEILLSRRCIICRLQRGLLTVAIMSAPLLTSINCLYGINTNYRQKPCIDHENRVSFIESIIITGKKFNEDINNNRH